MHLVSNLPKNTKVSQVTFTQNRMFVLSEKGEVFLYKVMEHFPSKDEVSMMGMKAVPQIRGELMVNEDPIQIKDLGKVK